MTIAQKVPNQRGMTLIELLIALVIVGILTSVAFPLYNRYQERTYRATAIAELGVCAQALERFYTVNYTYAGAADDGGGNPVAVGAPLSATCSAAAPSSGTALYDISITVADATQFTLRATPIADEAADGTGLLELDATGARRWDKNADGDTNDDGEDNWDE